MALHYEKIRDIFAGCPVVVATGEPETWKSTSMKAVGAIYGQRTAHYPLELVSNTLQWYFIIHFRVVVLQCYWFSVLHVLQLYMYSKSNCFMYCAMLKPLHSVLVPQYANYSTAISFCHNSHTVV